MMILKMLAGFVAAALGSAVATHLLGIAVGRPESFQVRLVDAVDVNLVVFPTVLAGVFYRACRREQKRNERLRS